MNMIARLLDCWYAWRARRIIRKARTWAYLERMNRER